MKWFWVALLAFIFDPEWSLANNVENLTKRLNALDENRGYFRFDEICSALQRATPGETLFEALHREHLGKTIDPDLVAFLLGKPPDDRSKSL